MITNKNCFFINDMTSLRYAIPFIKTVKELLGVQLTLVFDKTSTKYNSISLYEDRFRQICVENNIESLEEKDALDISIDKLFCVENVSSSRLSCRKHFSFQHGFDYRTLSGIVKDTTYLVTEEHFKIDLDRLGIEAKVQPVPVIFWDWEHTIQFIQKAGLMTKSAVIFYPENGLHAEFFKIYSSLKEQGFETYVKQREKNQRIPSNISHIFYDKVWYPSESVFLPVCADVCFGLGTSAYTDIYHLRKFIDFSIPNYSKNYYKPSSEKFKTLTGTFEDLLNDCCNLQHDCPTINDKLKNPCDYAEIKKFLEQVFE